jgi:hypothetical protein
MITADIKINGKRLGFISITPVTKGTAQITDWDIKYTREPYIDEGKRFITGEFELYTGLSPENVISRALAEAAHWIQYDSPIVGDETTEEGG